MAFLQNIGLIPRLPPHSGKQRTFGLAKRTTPRLATFGRLAGATPPCTSTLRCLLGSYTVKVKHRGAELEQTDSAPYYVGILVQKFPGVFECTTDGETRGAVPLQPRYEITLRYCKKLQYPAITKLVYWKAPLFGGTPEYKTRELVPNTTYEIP
jgi:hypothetical protein